MSDTNTPFLSKTQSESDRTPDKRHRSLDETIERCIGDFGWAQFIQALLASLAWTFDAQQAFITVFSDVRPTWHCTQLSNLCNSVSDICQLSKAAWAWDLPPQASIVSEWSLECAGRIVTGLPASSFFAGCIVGGLALATLADSSLGRKNTLLLSCLSMSLAGLLTGVSPNIWVYSALKFVSGFGRATIATCALVLSTELVGKRWRGQVGIIGFFCFTMGFLSLPAIAYLNRGSSWRLLYIWTCVPAIFYCVSIHFLVRESPRWLFVKGHKEEFIESLKSIAPANASALTLSFSDVSMEINEHSENVDLYSAMRMLAEKSWAIRRLSAVMVIGFGVGTVYYGMPLGLGDLGFNLYLSVTLNALSELPAAILLMVWIGRLKRKSAVVGFTVLSGACSIMCAVAKDEWKGVKIASETLAFFSNCTAFNVLLIYTLELFPTCVRNSAMSMVRLAVVMGGVVGPLVVATGGENGGAVSYWVFGVCSWCCGLFVAFLPETKGGTLCDTMDEEEHKARQRCPVPAP